jgi:DNA-directed RNA polymerase subunit RPC12/RpoP
LFFQMISVGIEIFVSGFLAIGLLFFMLVWLYYDRRDRLYYDRQRIRHIHHCVKCGMLYTTAEEANQLAACPGCGFRNVSLRF